MGFVYTRKMSLDGNSYRISIPAWIAKEWARSGVRVCDVEYVAHEDKIVVKPIRPRRDTA